MNKTAIGISCWNRPDYFQRMIISLEANIKDMEDVDTHLFVDGDICMFTGEKRTDRQLIQQNISFFQKALLPNKFLHVRTLNVSVAIHQFQMMQMLTSIYPRIIFLEDDVVLSPNFIVMMKKSLDQFEQDPKVFSVSPSFKLLCKPEDVNKNINLLKFTEGHFWAEAIWTEKWKKILPYLREYMDIVEEKPYHQRDNSRINALFENSGRKMLATSQDNAKDWAVWRSGMKRARFIVNRATGIGEIGIHSTKDKLAKTGDGNNKIYVFDDERTVKLAII